MSKWFAASEEFTSALSRPEVDRISDCVWRAVGRMEVRADSSWLEGVEDYLERYEVYVFLVAVDINERHLKFSRRYNPRGANNYLIKVPLNELRAMSDAAACTYLENAFIECCEDAARRWGTRVSWRIDPHLRSPS
jgi:hypothetical protein